MRPKGDENDEPMAAFFAFFGRLKLATIIPCRFRLIEDLFDFEPLQAGRHLPLNRVSDSISERRRSNRGQD